MLFIIIFLITNLLYLIYSIDLNSFIKVKGTNSVIQVYNVQINGVDVALAHISDGAIYIGGKTAAGKVVKKLLITYWS